MLFKGPSLCLSARRVRECSLQSKTMRRGRSGGVVGWTVASAR